MTKHWQLAHGRFLELNANSAIMGILNVTPDSFSDGGQFGDVDSAVLRAAEMLREGAAIIDVGGESTRPGSTPVSSEQEQSRILPVIEELASKLDALISVDTYRPETARLALRAGAHIVNDVWGLQKDPGIAEIAAEHGAGLVIMHTGRERSKLPDIIDDQTGFLTRSLTIAKHAGVSSDQIVLDPGFGFAKDVDENLALMARFEELRVLGHPLMAGTSRKRFIGAIAGRDVDQRDVGTAASSALLRMKGAALFRVHDVAFNRDALRVADAMLAATIDQDRAQR